TTLFGCLFESIGSMSGATGFACVLHRRHYSPVYSGPSDPCRVLLALPVCFTDDTIRLFIRVYQEPNDGAPEVC
ncbi:MAG: hypothetical protein KDB03_27315, partial [Planctomycetales bacterium]|nr:hypothetical protein [Planctomycetales bacterium]